MKDRHPIEVALLGVAALVVIVALLTGGWFLYWRVARSSTNRRAEISRETFGFQQSRRDDLIAQMAKVASVDTQVAASTNPDTTAALIAQRTAMVTQACHVAAEIRGDLPRGTTEFVNTEC